MYLQKVRARSPPDIEPVNSSVSYQNTNNTLI